MEFSFTCWLDIALAFENIAIRGLMWKAFPHLARWCTKPTGRRLLVQCTWRTLFHMGKVRGDRLLVWIP